MKERADHFRGTRTADHLRGLETIMRKETISCGPFTRRNIYAGTPVARQDKDQEIKLCFQVNQVIKAVFADQNILIAVTNGNPCLAS